MKPTDRMPPRYRDADQLRTLLALHAIALGAVEHGLCLFDADHRLVLFNQNFIEMFDLSPEVVRPGVPLACLLAHGAERGAWPSVALDELEREHREGLAQQDPFDLLANGATIAFRFRPIAGGGWAATYEDVSAQLQAEHEPRARLDWLDQALSHMTNGVCVFDANERLVFCNDEYLRIYGFDRATLRPETAFKDLLADIVRRGAHGATTLDQIYERSMALVRGQDSSTDRLHLSDGRVIERTLRPLAGGGWVGYHEDITAQLRYENAYRERNLLLDAALDHMAHGLCAFDRDLRVIVVNRRYLDMYGLSHEDARPGTTLLELMRRSIARGIHYPGITAEEMFADFKQRLIDNKEPVLHRRLANGCIVAVRHQPMANGGWVGTYEDITERHRSEENIARMARHDALTDLPNRLLFREKMSDGLARVAAVGESMAVMCIDLDNFKTVNDTLGHPFGDRLLRSVGERLRSVIGDGDTIARIGGDEFAVLQSATTPTVAERLAGSLIETMSQSIVLDGHEFNTGISIGIAIAPHDGTASDDLMKCADLALYRAKADGRNTFRFFEPNMGAQVQARRALELDLRRAFAAGDFDLVYQPLVSLASREVTGMEALLRWTHGERGPISPAEFIPLAEETGLIVPLGEWVLRRACAEAARWPEPIKVAVNLSPLQFRSPGFVATVTNALASAGLASRRLEFEITEAVLLQNDETILGMLHQLRSLGIRISMDDFGTGYSSLGYLRSFPFDKIKIDRSFISAIGRETGAIIRTIASLGAALGIETTAEGVETSEQLEVVRRAGCTEVQGYLISRPLPAGELPHFIARFHQIGIAA